MSQLKRPILMIILDGIGGTFDNDGNAVTRARTPNLERLWSAYPHGYLKASEEFVGLPSGTKGNSEVGHANLGAGSIVYQSLLRIDKAIELGVLNTNNAINSSIAFAQQNGGRLHIMGLLSDGGTHSHISHFLKILEIIGQKAKGIEVFFHCFLDGRDSEPKGASKYLEQLEAKISEVGVGKIASIIGRAYAMDRDKRWDRIEKAYRLLVDGKGEKVSNWKEVLEKGYLTATTDEFIEPFCIEEFGVIKNGDSVLFMNFRADRAVELTKSLIDPLFDGFKRDYIGDSIFFASMMSYQKNLEQYSNLIFPRNNIQLPLGRVLAERGLTQLRIAESEKYPHVTYFFNGGQNLKFLGEERINIPSPSEVVTYDEKPEMSIVQVTNSTLSAINMDRYDVIVLNYANGDMVGHTGNISATIKAIEYVDYCVGQLVKAMLARGGIVMITADHGNAEEMKNIQTGEMDTEHSIFPVPFMIVGDGFAPITLPIGKLADFAPTALGLLNIPVPISMGGVNLYK
ncbi:MAG TPA: 2,3-bisphosphoglycerate-independent phosphoglycerate mutase [Candidatus Dojkabacteria bacterium]|nr:2,3-bisphosphoglycerate-independent phosphoglycerate mutase [Candidatus Dojkabacteria bacterium]HQF37132.1 2,3-bisphosphoglycerate-independent phosphoglycerate mutase [Candidatus Dojkabacteria bacterium]